VTGFDSEDLASFFDTDDFAVEATISDDAPWPPFSRTLFVNFDENSLAVSPYAELDIEVADPSFLCRSIDLAGVKRGMSVTFEFPSNDVYEPLFGKTFLIEKWISQGPGMSRVSLKES
jgi:hypothetical protein